MRTRKTLPSALAALAATVTVAGMAVPTTAAADPVWAAPGAPMRVFPQNPPETVKNKRGQEIKVPEQFWVDTCSQGPVGTVKLPDGTTQRVILTASHCVDGKPGNPPVSDAVKVPVNTGSGYERVGRTIKSSHVPAAALDLSDPVLSITAPDWAVVLVDDSVGASNLAQSRDANGGAQGEPVAITSIRDFRTLAPGEVSVDNFGQPICKDGATTGRSCGTQLGRTRNGIYSWGLDYRPGDSGGINYDPRDGAALGVSTIVFNSLGKAQPADRIIEDAYGVPDGQVNEYFTPAAPAPREEFVPFGVEAQYVADKVAQDNPDLQPANPQQELDNALGKAQQDARQAAEHALTGQLDPAQLQQTARDNAANISYWAGAALAASSSR